MKRLLAAIFFSCSFVFSHLASAADVVPTDVQQPGTQPLEIGNLESPGKCDNCHGGYNSAVEPAHNWQGSMMAHAGRDPIFWATLAIAEQDFDGAGDLCIRCHSTAGWLAGRSTPTDGSGLAAGDSDGVECDYCHKLTNPDDTELRGEMYQPFVANEKVDNEVIAYRGSGMSSMWGGADKLGPYDDATARHQFIQSNFHRDRDFCGTCHDVSNPVTGDLAPGNGSLKDPSGVIASGVPKSPVDGKAAFNNLPHQYGIVERTFSEYKSAEISQTLVDDFGSLPEDLRGGVLEAIYNAAYNPTTGTANYTRPPMDRYYSCQSCHMRPVTGKGANKRDAPVRSDLPLHDITGGNYWMPEAIEWLDARGLLRLGGGMSNQQIQAMRDGALRAKEQLQLAATLDVDGNTVRVINHTGHKLITGYPEGRRMWLQIEWLNASGGEIHTDGDYGPITVSIDDVPVEVNSILDLNGTNTKIYEAHMGMTQEWAARLMAEPFKVPAGLVLQYDRYTGQPKATLGDLAAMAPGSKMATFHFALNNTVVHDNRIPPYKMNQATAIERNAAPFPLDEYPVDASGNYPYFDEVTLKPPSGAVAANIHLLYQPTSWEYIQFLYEANNGSNAFLGQEGKNMLDAWLDLDGEMEHRMGEPFVMASATWGNSAPGCEIDPPTLDSAIAGQGQVTLDWTGPSEGDITDYSLYYDQSDKTQLVANLVCADVDCTTYTDTGLTNTNELCYVVTANTAECESSFSNMLCATPQPPGQTQYASVSILETGHWVREGKGKHATETFVVTDTFSPGDAVVVRLAFSNSDGQTVTGA